MKQVASILWRRVDHPGHEYAALGREEAFWCLTGVAVFEEKRQPCRLEYSVKCDSSWSTISADVAGSVGQRAIEAKIRTDGRGTWKLNGEPCPQVDGCSDVDLNFSPSTNLLPIRRLNLDIGQEARVRAAWLRFPTFSLEPLEQTYRRLGERTFRYESAGGAFIAEIEVSEAGLPLRYGDIWSAETESS